MKDVIIRPFQSEDEQAVLHLNETFVQVLSPMDGPRFHLLKRMTAVLWVAERGSDLVAFLMAFSDGADYDSVNYQWFSRRLKGFLYIDRVVVSEKVRSSGIGRRFYTELEEWARSRGISWLAAEVDLEPPNLVSLRFHHRQQFIEVARQTAGKNNKIVSLQIKNIESLSNELIYRHKYSEHNEYEAHVGKHPAET